MTVKVLVVDDSGFFRRRVEEFLNADPGIEVVGFAVNGLEAVSKVKELKPDVVTMDIEMPVMDGISAVRRVMKERPTPVLMFSSLTHQGAQATFDALEAGAVDFLPKQMEAMQGDQKIRIARQLRTRVRLLGRRGFLQPAANQRPGSEATSGLARAATGRRSGVTSNVSASPAVKHPRGSFNLLAIGTSTGGPVALQRVLTELPKAFPVPVLLVQHMPASFTPAFAQRLDRLCQIEVREAQDRDLLMPGVALLAPGGTQMVLEKRGGTEKVRILPGASTDHFKPSVDTTFQSIADHHIGKSLAIVLTGMGADGREGARSLKSQGSSIWIQDEASCVVYGMPMAIEKAGLAERALDLNDFTEALKETF